MDLGTPEGISGSRTVISTSATDQLRAQTMAIIDSVDPRYVDVQRCLWGRRIS